ncbi:MAG TPA: flagellar filament capping protein FliD [Azospira sp.]|nr:flagellar filament capping protein FliD [Azospira sp.]
MSPLSIASTAFSLLSALGDSRGTSSSSASGSAGKGDFAASLALRMASQRTQSFDSLLGTMSGKGPSGGLDALFDGFSGIAGFGSTASDALASLGLAGKSDGLSAFGRNLSLFDPESGYRMMTDINNRDVTYKAQFAELSEMKAAVGEMRRAGEALAAKMSDATTAGDDAALAAQLQSFVTQYNDWVGRFDGTVKAGGLLAGTQAAEVSLHELRQSIGNIFNGAAGGVRGMPDLGLSTDPASGLATLDGERLRHMLATNRDGVVAAVGEFGRHFARSAELLVSENNFIPNRLGNLDRVIDYIGEHRSSLQGEFGLGDAARPSALVARALAAYEKMIGA